VNFEDDPNISLTLKISPDWWEFELSENSSGILETDDLQDIPEDDDRLFLNKLLLTSF